ncbi:MAG: hypothetical protein HZC55_19750 [Verrucomicrobia bacterium]|nr:hypothetical protein [Verrucomicrobiota bacterium]
MLKLSAETPRPSDPRCHNDGPMPKGGSVEMKFNSVSGKIDQAVGVSQTTQERAASRMKQVRPALRRMTAGGRLGLSRLGRFEAREPAQPVSALP